jgi:hypothetical protein
VTAAAHLPSTTHPLTPARALLLGALAVGTLDGLDAALFFGLRGVAPLRVFQSIASGLLGRAAFRGGVAAALLGVLLHFTIAAGVVGVCYALARRWPALARRPLVWGPAYGLLVYAAMEGVVVPLSAAVTGPKPAAVVLNGLLIHALGVGVPSALAARAALRARAGTA